jgi:hypothetical protein
VFALATEADYGGHIGEVCEKVADKDWYEGQTDLDGTKSPLLIDRFEAFEESEDERVAEAAEEGEPEDNGLSEEHVEGSV